VVPLGSLHLSVQNNPCVSKSAWEPAYVRAAYRIGARLLGYEVTVRPAAGGRGGVFCVFEGRYGQTGVGGWIGPPQLGLCDTGLNLGHSGPSVRCLVC